MNPESIGHTEMFVTRNIENIENKYKEIDRQLRYCNNNIEQFNQLEKNFRTINFDLDYAVSHQLSAMHSRVSSTNIYADRAMYSIGITARYFKPISRSFAY
jgi:hypothetical protein